jgi:hypothetical protein
LFPKQYSIANIYLVFFTILDAISHLDIDVYGNVNRLYANPAPFHLRECMQWILLSKALEWPPADTQDGWNCSGRANRRTCRAQEKC